MTARKGLLKPQSQLVSYSLCPAQDRTGAAQLPLEHCRCAPVSSTSQHLFPLLPSKPCGHLPPRALHPSQFMVCLQASAGSLPGCRARHVGAQAACRPCSNPGIVTVALGGPGYPAGALSTLGAPPCLHNEGLLPKRSPVLRKLWPAMDQVNKLNISGCAVQQGYLTPLAYQHKCQGLPVFRG